MSAKNCAYPIIILTRLFLILGVIGISIVSPVHAISAGNVGAWKTETNNLPKGLYAATSVAYNGHVYVIGGYDGNSVLSSVYSATLNPDGAVGAWTEEGNELPTVLYGASSTIYNGHVYVIGGYDGNSVLSSVYSATLNPDGSVGAWTSDENTLPGASYLPTSAAYNGHIYVIGGNSSVESNIINTVYSATLNPDGSVGAWTTEANSLPSPAWGASAATSNGHVYVIGGSDNTGSNIINTVYSAPLNPDGSVGAWTTEANSLPSPAWGASAATSNGHVYVIGGSDNTGSNIINTVYSAPLNPDGSVGAWTTEANSLPSPVFIATSAVYNGHVYVIGGSDANNILSSVYSTTLNSDGSIGSWTIEANALPTTLLLATSVAYNGHVYVMGGYDGQGFNSTVYSDFLNGLLSQSSDAVPNIRTTVPVLTNAVDSQDTSTLTIVSQPSHGTALASTGGIAYTPENAYIGTDTLVYRICASYNHDLCSTVTLTINVTFVAPNTGMGANLTSPMLTFRYIFAGIALLLSAYLLRRIFVK